MPLEAFQCDVCLEPITPTEVKVHLQKHQAQILSLLSRLPDDSNQTRDEPTDGSVSPHRIQKRCSQPESQPRKARRVQTTRPKLFRCSQCEHQSKRPHDHARHYTRHHDCNATCPKCNKFYVKTNEFLNKTHTCLQDPTPELTELKDTVIKDVERQAGVSFKFRRQRHSFCPEPERSTVQTTLEGSATQPEVPYSEPDIGEMLESLIYEPQIEGFLNDPFAIMHNSL